MLSRTVKSVVPAALMALLLVVGCSLPGSGSAGSSGGGASGAGAGGSASSGPCANPLLPVVVGAAWNYQMSGLSSDAFVRTINSASESGFEDQDTFGSGTTRTGRWNCEAGNLIALDPTGGSTATVQAGGQMADFETIESSGVTLPATVEPGAAWTQSITIAGAMDFGGIASEATNSATLACTGIGMESVTVPAGTFDAMKITCQNSAVITVTTSGVTVPIPEMVFSVESWYAPGVGLVKSVTTGEGLDSTVVLTSYSLP